VYFALKQILLQILVKKKARKVSAGIFLPFFQSNCNHFFIKKALKETKNSNISLFFFGRMKTANISPIQVQE